MLLSCCQSLSSLFLKALVDGASVTCWGRWFQSVTTLWLKNIQRIRLLFLAWDSFRLCRLRSWPVSANWKNWVGSMFSFLVIILYVSIRSPLRRLFSSVVSFRTLSLSSYGFFLKVPTNFVALLWTRSRHLISFFRYGDQTCMQYPRWVRMYALYGN